MERTYISECINHTFVTVRGMVQSVRDSKQLLFLVVTDISGSIQITIIKNENPVIAKIASKLTPDSFIGVTGTVVKNEHVKMGGIEIMPESISVNSIADPLPIIREGMPKTKHKPAIEKSSIDQRLDYRWIDLRTRANQLIFLSQTCLVNAMREYLINQKFIELHTPKLIGSASESGSEVFKVQYYDKDAYLAQSPQFYKQMAMAGGLEKIFEIGPAFRAEKSHTNKHASEFTGFDVEVSYITSFHDLMHLEEELIVSALSQVKQQYGDNIHEHFGLDVIIPSIPFPVITLTELYTELEREFAYKVSDHEKNDMTTEAERLSYQWVKAKFNHEFLFVTGFNAENRAFYHKRENNISQGFDLIWRGTEITTGAQREHCYEILKKQADEKGLGDDVQFYLEFFKYGCPVHGGFGIGVDRMTMLLLGLSIKDVMFIHRSPNRLRP